MVRRGGLGRGLDALIPGEPREGLAEDGPRFRELPVGSIEPNPHQPRKSFDELALAGLVDSVAAVGVLQPILVRGLPSGRFQLIAGERRWRAARKIGLLTVPALVQQVDDVTSLQQAVVENLHRVDLGPLEEASAYRELIEGYGMSHEEVAARVSKSRAAVTNALRLFQLPADVQRMVAERHLSAGHARALLTAPDRERQVELARRCVAEQLSVRALEEAARNIGQDSDVRLQRLDSPESAPATAAHTPGAQRPASGPLPPVAALEVERQLGDRLDTRVTVEMGSRRGRVVIDFATVADLERIFDLLMGAERPDGLEGA
ncbi:MAG: ParB/RepB/Spo0J family partition protein [Actinomycetota bacterium]|nr:ParB/RepB/Spo0J family partition protein [Actinomycetota bacterium]